MVCDIDGSSCKLVPLSNVNINNINYDDIDDDDLNMPGEILRTSNSRFEVPSARSAHSACLYKGDHCVYIFGGWDGRRSNNDFFKYSMRDNIWQRVKCNGKIPEPRRAHGAVIVGDYMYIYGGFDGIKNVPPVLHRYNFLTKTWEEVEVKSSVAPPCGRSRTRLVYYHDKLAVIGGWDRVNHFQNWHEFNLKTSTWSETKLDYPQGGIAQHSAVVYKNSVYVFGGHNEKENQSSNLLWSYFLGKHSSLSPTSFLRRESDML
eukprot:TRINITY_DN6145_c0_g2_i3.p1 TRINITY_DN6145_c0_g2~~TRINITY_DN6145_c0_g2_i3.p1  ORF type:complete len:261 (-),score=14.86 TRINITY_DN6145_c0_g2_i3:422-1204(-)